MLSCLQMIADKTGDATGQAVPRIEPISQPHAKHLQGKLL
jgi:hypothetical protein